MGVVGNDPVGKKVERTVTRHLDVVGHDRAVRLDRDDWVPVLGVCGRKMPLDTGAEVLRRDDEVWEVSVLVREVVRGTVHAVHFPIDAVEIEVAHPPVGERLVHLELDALFDQPLAHLALWPACAPHAVRCDRAVPVAGAGVVGSPYRVDGPCHLLGAPLSVVSPQPLHALVHCRNPGALHVWMRLVHPAHVGSLLLVWSRSLVGPHPKRGDPIPFLALRRLTQRCHRSTTSLTLLVGDHRGCDELRDPDLHVTDLDIAGGRQQSMIHRRLDLATACAAHANDRLTPGLNDARDLMRTDLAVRPHRHDLAGLQAVGLREPDPLTVRQDHPGVA